MKKRADGGGTRASPPRRQAFPALTTFVRGYLHEDFPEVHGSARAAAAAFCADATREERQELGRELSSLVEIFSGRPVRDLQRFFGRELGSAWHPQSHAELDELAALIRPGA